jgi:hypothetical protein
MRHILVALICLGFLATPARSQGGIDPKVAEAARAMVAKTGAAAQYERMLDLMIGQVIDATQRSNPQSKPQEVEAIFREIILPELKGITPAIMEVSIAAYAERFTLAELTELSAFYDTPLGQKLLSTTPELMADIMQATGAIAERAVLGALEKHAEALRRRGIQVPL